MCDNDITIMFTRASFGPLVLYKLLYFCNSVFLFSLSAFSRSSSSKWTLVVTCGSSSATTVALFFNLFIVFLLTTDWRDMGTLTFFDWSTLHVDFSLFSFTKFLGNLSSSTLQSKRLTLYDLCRSFCGLNFSFKLFLVHDCPKTYFALVRV